MIPCKNCGEMISFIHTHHNRLTPVAAETVMRDGSDPLPVGMYYDAVGNLYSEAEAPVKVKLWRSHWSDCPGAKDFRRRHP